jgi:hypothetical protein
MLPAASRRSPALRLQPASDRLEQCGRGNANDIRDLYQRPYRRILQTMLDALVVVHRRVDALGDLSLGKAGLEAKRCDPAPHLIHDSVRVLHVANETLLR